MSKFVQGPAILVYISDVTNGRVIKEVIKEGEERFRYVLMTANNEKIYRIRATGTLVHKYHSLGSADKKEFTAISIDDGTETIQVKGWEEDAQVLNRYGIGDEVDIIGRPRSSDDEIFLVPETVINVDSHDRELYMRAKKVKRYLDKGFTIPALKREEPEQEIDEEKEKARDKVWEIIAESNSSVTLDEILEKTKLEKVIVEEIIHDLLNRGDIFEPTALEFRKA